MMRQAPTTRKVQKIVYYFCGMLKRSVVYYLTSVLFLRQFSFCFTLIVGILVHVLILSIIVIVKKFSSVICLMCTFCSLNKQPLLKRSDVI